MVHCYLRIFGSNKGKMLCYQDFVVWHSVCSQSIPVKSNTVRGCSGVHCIYLPCEQPVMCAPETSFGTIYKKESCYLCYSRSQSNYFKVCVRLHYQWLLFLCWVLKGFHLEGLCSSTHQKSFPAAADASFASSAAKLSVPRQKTPRSTWTVPETMTLSSPFEQRYVFPLTEH